MIAAARVRPLTWFLLLLFFNLLLLSVQVRSPDGTLLLRSWGLLAWTPAAMAFSSAARYVSSSFDRYVLAIQAWEETQRLTQENDRLRIEVNRLRGVLIMMNRFSDFQRLRSQYDFDTVVAGVIGLGDGIGSPLLGDRMAISRGRLSGISVDSAVFSPDGLIGRVFAVNPLSAEVQLITAEGAATGVIGTRSGLQGVLLGKGGGRLNLEFIPNSEIVETGELLVTSGADRIYPRGIPAGRVVSSSEGPVIYRLIDVQPLVDIQRTSEVLVEVDSPEGDASAGSTLEDDQGPPGSQGKGAGH